MPDEKQEDRVRLVRIIEYIGPRSRVEEQIKRSLHGTMIMGHKEGNMYISAVTLGDFPEILAEEPAPPYKPCRFWRGSPMTPACILGADINPKLVCTVEAAVDCLWAQEREEEDDGS